MASSIPIPRHLMPWRHRVPSIPMHLQRRGSVPRHDQQSLPACIRRHLAVSICAAGHRSRKASGFIPTTCVRRDIIAPTTRRRTIISLSHPVPGTNRDAMPTGRMLLRASLFLPSSTIPFRMKARFVLGRSLSLTTGSEMHRCLRITLTYPKPGGIGRSITPIFQSLMASWQGISRSWLRRDWMGIPLSFITAITVQVCRGTSDGYGIPEFIFPCW